MLKTIHCAVICTGAKSQHTQNIASGSLGTLWVPMQPRASLVPLIMVLYKGISGREQGKIALSSLPGTGCRSKAAHYPVRVGS